MSFTVRVPGSAAGLNEKLLAAGILGGYDLGQEDASLGRYLVLAATELNTREGIDRFIKVAAS
jgi:glycine dehydrogenase subunit 1